MGGLQTADKLRQLYPGIKIVMVTALWDREEGRKAMEHGAVDYIIKPFEMDRIKLLIQSLL